MAWGCWPLPNYHLEHHLTPRPSFSYPLHTSPPHYTLQIKTLLTLIVVGLEKVDGVAPRASDKDGVSTYPISWHFHFNGRGNTINDDDFAAGWEHLVRRDRKFGSLVSSTAKHHAAEHVTGELEHGPSPPGVQVPAKAGAAGAGARAGAGAGTGEVPRASACGAVANLTSHVPRGLPPQNQPSLHDDCSSSGSSGSSGGDGGGGGGRQGCHDIVPFQSKWDANALRVWLQALLPMQDNSVEKEEEETAPWIAVVMARCSSAHDLEEMYNIDAKVDAGRAGGTEEASVRIRRDASRLVQEEARDPHGLAALLGDRHPRALDALRTELARYQLRNSISPLMCKVVQI